MNMRSSDLSARLLATENLAVIRANARTASFDIKSRVLTLPMWKEMTPEVEDMLIGHEVGHALYTTDKYIEPLRENPKLMGYMNIVEDVRIEKLIKRKYPGLRKRMNEGYKQLNDRDFFGTKTVQNFDDLLLIDRINLYFKVGFQCGVTFTPEEKQFVNRAERTETVEEVIQLAQDIYAYAKEQAEKKKQERQAAGEADDEEDEDQDPIFGDYDIDTDGEFDEVEDEFDRDMNPLNNKAGNREDDSQRQEQDEDIEAKTDRVFQQKLEDLADTNTEYNYWKFDTNFFEDPVVGYKKVLAETKTAEQWMEEDGKYDYRTRYMNDVEQKEFYAKEAAAIESFKVESLRTVNYLVKEFEMKKSAQLYKRAAVSKVGSLDMKKVYAYKLQDDLFKRVTTLPQGKNHGMIMLLDWSGSMENVLQDTLKQVINLAMFCQRIQVPYRVFAFTTAYEEDMDYDQRVERHQRWKEWAEGRYSSEENILSNANGFHLIELFSNRMSTTEFNAMTKRVLDHRFRWNKGYNTSGTPLNEALAWVYLNLGTFIKNNNLEKTTFITLTDGEGGQLASYNRHKSLDDSTYKVVDGQHKRVKQRHFIKDEVTQNTYEIRRDSTVQTETILRMIKDRYNVTTVGFYICRNHRRDLYSVIHANIPNYNGSVEQLIDSWRKDFRANNFASVKNTGRDELFLIPQTATKIEEGELDVKADAKAISIAKNFSKYLNVKKTSRVLLNRFVTLVA